MLLFRLLLAITLACLTITLLTARTPPQASLESTTSASAPHWPQPPVGALAFAAGVAVLLLGRGGRQPPR